MAPLHSIAVLSLSLLPALSNAIIPTLSNFFNITTFPNEQKANVTRYLSEAGALATDTAIYQYFQDQCIVQQVYPPLLQAVPGFVQPFTPFENLFFIGHSRVSSWAYNTTEGLVVIDALDNQAEVEAILLPGLEAFGLRGADIKHLIIAHEHADHYGGARYLQETFNLAVYASEAAWEGMEAIGAINPDPPVPRRDRILGDGQDLIVGDVTFHVVLTPGHTPGTLSLIFPVIDESQQHHIAGLSGGTGTPRDAPSREDKITSQYRFAEICKDRGVDTLISNHQVADHALWHADMLAHRVAGAPNPFVIGIENFDKYMRINAICSRVIAAREGQDLQI
ncbi:beta-lactamase-like protein [Aspergillus cavernicola]|uniref:Beta-lactamase-like protein n=1 Tax=Aspergillus cavernicola TaxID=176166 RepID=A0ABR4IC56_9EURO